MMKTVMVSGWNVGFQKVKFTEMLRKEFGYSLSGAKAATDGVLENERLYLNVEDAECSRIVNKLRELGAKFSLEA